LQRCESFLSERELTEDGLCPNHMVKPQEVVEENYFFKLSKYRQQIIDHINANPEFILPSYRKNEILNQLEDIQDISVSRPTSSVSWGIPILGDKDQVIYVWIDALSNYITPRNETK
jgi:methionyl-tRNA synthetase